MQELVQTRDLLQGQLRGGRVGRDPGLHLVHDPPREFAVDARKGLGKKGQEFDLRRSPRQALDQLQVDRGRVVFDSLLRDRCGV